MNVKKYRKQLRRSLSILTRIQELYEEELKKNNGLTYKEILEKYFGVNSASKLD